MRFTRDDWVLFLQVLLLMLIFFFFFLNTFTYLRWSFRHDCSLTRRLDKDKNFVIDEDEKDKETKPENVQKGDRESLKY